MVLVALRKESVDRNDVLAISAVLELIVALRKESVDRNTFHVVQFLTLHVALRKESVDRNLYTVQRKAACLWSLSARRAWIEMQDDGD